MITRQMALNMRQKFVDDLPKRIDAAITSAALGGVTPFTVTVSYVPAGPSFATQVMNDYKKAVNNNDGGGWTNSTIDTGAQTITIAP